MKVIFVDSGLDPKCAPNPAYPDGIDIDISRGAAATCIADLPYPAPRCGVIEVECEACGYRAALTTAGRPDDPRTLKMPCQRPETLHA